MTDTDDLVKRLREIGEEEMYHHPASTKRKIDEAADRIEALASQLAALRDEAKKTLGYFLRDERFQVGVGGNPRVVEAMLSNAAAFLAKLEDMKP